MSECVLKTLACRGLCVGPSKVHTSDWMQSALLSDSWVETSDGGD